MPKSTENEQELPRENPSSEGTSTVNKINLELSFENSDQKTVEAMFKEHADVVGQLTELSARSEKLRSILDENPALAKEFAEDPVRVVARIFPELKLEVPVSKPAVAEKYRVTFKEGGFAPDGALLALRRALEYVAAAPSNEAAFVADPLGILRQANLGQPAADVARAERALEQVLGIFRLERLPIQDWVYASSQLLTLHRPR